MKTRAISAIIALIIVIPILFIGGPLFYIAATIIGIIGFKELLDLRKNERKIPKFVFIINIISFIFIVLSSVNHEIIDFNIDYKFLPIIIFLNLIPLVFYHDNKKYNINDALYLVGAIFFLGIAFNYLILIREFDLNYLIFLLLLTIFTDTFAYITGMLIGKHKMVPSISPKKTWEGFIGGTIFGVLISTVFYVSAFDFGGNLILLILIVTLLSIVGQLGDLVFSSIKRHYKVKDFGNIMPGHGGILDRLDSILFVVLAFSFIMIYL